MVSLLCEYREYLLSTIENTYQKWKISRVYIFQEHMDMSTCHYCKKWSRHCLFICQIRYGFLQIRHKKGYSKLDIGHSAMLGITPIQTSESTFENYDIKTHGPEIKKWLFVCNFFSAKEANTFSMFEIFLRSLSINSLLN